jgi:hypothetical protein
MLIVRVSSSLTDFLGTDVTLVNRLQEGTSYLSELSMNVRNRKKQLISLLQEG